MSREVGNLYKKHGKLNMKIFREIKVRKGSGEDCVLHTAGFMG
jgi:hypothetical protein